MSTFISDTFTDTAGTNLTAHTPGTGGAWSAALGSPTWLISATGTAYATAATGGNALANATTIPSVSSGATIVLEFDLVSKSLITNSDIQCGLIDGSGNRYRFGYYYNGPGNGSNGWYFQRIDPGSITTQLGATATGGAPTAGGTQHVTLTYVPSTKVWTWSVDGTVLVGPITDSTYTPTKAFIEAYITGGASTGTTGFHVDNVKASAPPTAGTVSPTPTSSTVVSVAFSGATNGTSPYTYQLQRAPDASGSPGTYANVGSALTAQTTSATFPDDTGLTTGATYWYRVVVTDASPGSTVNGAGVSVVVTAPPTGTVEWTLDATSALGASPFSGTALANIYDGDFATYFASASTGGYLGIDLGSGVTGTPSRILIAGPATINWLTTCHGAALEYADTSGGTWTAPGDLQPDYVPPTRAFLPFAVAPGVAKRCWRLRRASNFFAAAELRFEGTYAAGLRSRPCRPILGPAAGRFRSGQSVTLTTTTGGASIYYTTDGTTPTTSSTLYSGAFTLSANAIGAPTTVKAIAYHAGCSTATSGVASGVFDCGAARGRFVPDSGVNEFSTGTVPQAWYDDRGLPLELHAGEVRYDATAAKYYAWGEFASPDQSQWDAYGFYIYTSTDLLNWHFESTIPPYGGLDGGTWGIGTRLSGFVNSSPTDPDKKYVFWAHVAHTDNASTGGGCVYGPTMAGPWTWIAPAAPPFGNVNDCTTFVDPSTGYKYLVYSVGPISDGRINAAKLDASTDYTTMDGTYVLIGDTGDGTREAPRVIEHFGKYFLITSKINPYNDSGGCDVKYKSASSFSALGSTGYVGTPFAVAPGVGTAVYEAQPAFWIPVQGQAGKYIIGMDRWTPGESPGKDLAAHARILWYPVVEADFLTASTIAIDSSSPWDLGVFASGSPRSYPRGINRGITRGHA